MRNQALPLKNSVSRGALVLLLAALGGASAGAVVFHDRFTHMDYGYSFTIPRGFDGLPYPAEGMVHGCKIESPSDHRWYVVAEAEYYEPTLAEPLRYKMDRVAETLRPRVENYAVGEVHEARLKGLKALAFKATYRERASRKDRVSEWLVAARPQYDMIYVFHLMSEPAAYPAAKPIFEQVVGSFELHRID